MRILNTLPETFRLYRLLWIFNSQSFALSTKKGLSEEKLFSVVSPGIEPGTQGQRFLTLSPLLYQQKKSLSEEKLFLKWCHQESNRGHKDFQSFALPTELWHLADLRVQK